MTVQDEAGTPGSEGAGDAADAAAVASEGTDGGGVGQEESIEELRAQLREQRAANAAYERMLERGEPAEGHDPPTGHGPRAAQSPAVDAIDHELEEAEAQIRVLAGRKDPQSVYLMRKAEADRDRYLNLRDTVAKGMQMLYDEVQELKMPEAEREGFKRFRTENRGRFRDTEAARLAYDGFLARQARQQPQPATPTTRQPSPPAARPRPMVDTTVRPVPSREAAERTMRGSDFDAKVAELRASNRHGEANELQRRYADKELTLTDD